MPITNTMNPSALSSSSSSRDGGGSGGGSRQKRHNVLLLGVSFPDIPGTLEDGGYKANLLTHKEPTAEQSVELVRRGILTEMDARDHARAVETERAYDGEDVRVYTVSREVGGVYRKDRHIYANFNNSRTLCQQLGRQFGWKTQFQQVILDYYWMPTGWLVTRWAKSLFQNTLPDLVRHRLLAFPSTRRGRGTGGDDNQDDDDGDEKEEESPEMEAGVVFLPFCAHVCKELVGAIKILREYYAISFVKKNELGGNALWKGTMRIDGKLMQHRLGKRLDQEEIYCTFNPTDIYKSMEDSHVIKDDVMTMLLSIEDFDEIRMIRLKPLRQHERPSPFRIEPVVPEKGGFMGLNWAMGKKRFKQLRKPGRKKVVAAVAVSEEEDESTTEEEEDESSSCYSSCDEDGLLGFGFDDDDDEDEEAFDPEDPDRIPDVLHYYPYPSLDLKSYTIPRELTDVDYVLDDWAVTWGPKAGRKSKKLDLARDSYREYRRQRTETLSMNERKPPVTSLATREEGYKWTWVEDFGWKLSLVGDAPDSSLEEKIVDRATRDHDMSMARALFQMKNPDYKVWSRTWMERKHMSKFFNVTVLLTFFAPQHSHIKSCLPLLPACYRIPRRSVLLKTHGSREDEEIIQASKAEERAEEAVTQSDEQKKLSKEAAESLMELATYLDNAKGVLSIDRLTELDVSNMTGPEMRLYLEAYGEPSIPKFKAQRRERLLEHIKDFQARKKSEGPSAADRVATLTSLFASDSSDSETEETSQKPILLGEFADYVAHLPQLEGVSTDVLRVVPGENYVHELPPFKSKSIAKHVRCNLSDHEGFPFELYKLLQRYKGLFAHVISWQDKGKSFKIHDEAAFEQSVLSQCSTDNDFQSFKQTLRRFGFQKISAGDRAGGYHHDLFRRGEAKQVPHILRRFNLPDLESDSENGSAIDPTEGPGDDAKSVTESASAVDTGSSSDKSSGEESYQPEALRRPKMTRKKPKRPAAGRAPGGMYNLRNGTTFLSELHRLLENAAADKLAHIVSWDAHGKAFRVHDKDNFLKMVLTQFSSMGSFQVFQAKMRRFEFQCNDTVFQHSNFIRGVLPGMNSKPVQSIKSGGRSISSTDARGKQKSKLQGEKPWRPKSQPTWSNTTSECSANVIAGPVDSFIDKLYELLGNAKKEKIEHILSWSSNGKSVIVHDCEAFDEVVAPNYLPTKFLSFRRRLYFFGFVKKGTPYRDVVTFTSPFFLRGKKDKLKFLHNSRNKRKHSASPSPSTSEGVHVSSTKKHKSNSFPLREEKHSKPRGRSTLTSAIANAPIMSSSSTSHSPSAPKERPAKPRGRMTLTSALASEDWTIVEQLSQSDTSPQPDEKAAKYLGRSAKSEATTSATKTLPGFLYHDYADEDPASLPELVIKMKKKGPLPVFPSNLYKLLERASADGNERICSFAEHGRCFFVHDEANFIAMVNKLGLAKHGSFSAFLNQLKRYGFHQLQHGKDSGGFFHEFFLRGRPLHAKRLRPFSRTNGGDPMSPLVLPEASEPDFWAMPFVKSLSSSCSQPRIEAEMDPKSSLEESAVTEHGAGSTLTDRRVSQKSDSALASPSVVSERSETAASLFADVASPKIDAPVAPMADEVSALRTSGVSPSKRKRSTMSYAKPNKGVVSSAKKARSGQGDVAFESDKRSIIPAPQHMTPSLSASLRLGVSDVGMQHSTPTRTSRRVQDPSTPPAVVQNRLVHSMRDTEEERQTLHSALSNSAAFQEGNIFAQNGPFLAKLGLSQHQLLRTLVASVSKGEQRARTFLEACVWQAGLRRQDSAIFSFLGRLFQSSDGTALERLKVIEKWATLLNQCHTMFAAKGSLTPLQSMTENELISLLHCSVQQMRERPDETMGMTLLRLEELSELNQFLDDFLALPPRRTTQMGNTTLADNDATVGGLQMSTMGLGDGVTTSSASLDSHSANSNSSLPTASSGVLQQLLGQIVPNAFERANATEEGGETLTSLFRPT